MQERIKKILKNVKATKRDLFELSTSRPHNFPRIRAHTTCTRSKPPPPPALAKICLFVTIFPLFLVRPTRCHEKDSKTETLLRRAPLDTPPPHHPTSPSPKNMNKRKLYHRCASLTEHLPSPPALPTSFHPPPPPSHPPSFSFQYNCFTHTVSPEPNPLIPLPSPHPHPPPQLSKQQAPPLHTHTPPFFVFFSLKAAHDSTDDARSFHLCPHTCLFPPPPSPFLPPPPRNTTPLPLLSLSLPRDVFPISPHSPALHLPPPSHTNSHTHHTPNDVWSAFFEEILHFQFPSSPPPLLCGATPLSLSLFPRPHTPLLPSFPSPACAVATSSQKKTIRLVHESACEQNTVQMKASMHATKRKE